MAPAEELRTWWLELLASGPAPGTAATEIVSPSWFVPAFEPPVPVEAAAVAIAPAPIEPVAAVASEEFDTVPEPIQPPAFLTRSEPFVFELPVLEAFSEPAAAPPALSTPSVPAVWSSSPSPAESTPGLADLPLESAALASGPQEPLPLKGHELVEPAEPEAMEAAPATPRRGPLSRLKTLVRDCIDEVASTFQSEEVGSVGISAGAVPSLQQEAPEPQFLQDPSARRPAVAPELPSVTTAPAAFPGARSSEGRPESRPAPAPPAPGLASLRSWLPDLPAEEERRAS